MFDNSFLLNIFFFVAFKHRKFYKYRRVTNLRMNEIEVGNRLNYDRVNNKRYQLLRTAIVHFILVYTHTTNRNATFLVA